MIDPLGSTSSTAHSVGQVHQRLAQLPSTCCLLSDSVKSPHSASIRLFKSNISMKSVFNSPSSPEQTQLSHCRQLLKSLEIWASLIQHCAGSHSDHSKDQVPIRLVSYTTLYFLSFTCFYHCFIFLSFDAYLHPSSHFTQIDRTRLVIYLWKLLPTIGQPFRVP